MQPLELQPVLIDRAYQQLVEAIADGRLAPGQRIRQEELGRALGVARQPISHAPQLLKQQKLVEENGRRELRVSAIYAARLRKLYQVRGALGAPAAKRDLSAGEMLDGEGGYTVWDKLVPAERSLAEGVLPIGLTHHVRLLHDIAGGEIVCWADVAMPNTEAVRASRDMERHFAAPSSAIAAR